MNDSKRDLNCDSLKAKKSNGPSTAVYWSSIGLTCKPIENFAVPHIRRYVQ